MPKKPILVVCPMHWDMVMRDPARWKDYTIVRGAVCDLC